MELEERKERCDGLASVTEDALETLPTTVIAWHCARDAWLEAISREPYWIGEHTERPEGDPDSVDESSRVYQTSAASQARTAKSIDLWADTLERDFSAHSGAYSAKVLRAFADLCELNAEGLDITSESLADYASTLRLKQASFDSHLYSLMSARDTVLLLQQPDAGQDLATSQTLVDTVRSTFTSVVAALRGASAAFASIIAAQTRLLYTLSDAEGYQRLASSGAPAGSSLQDTVLALAAGVDDPDTAIVSSAEFQQFVEQRSRLSPSGRTKLAELLDATTSPEERQILISAFATGAGLDSTIKLANRLRTASDQERSELLESLAGVSISDDSLFKQQTGTTCGSSSLLVLAAQRDPYLALFLAEGTLVGDYVPEFVRDLKLDFDKLKTMTGNDRLEALQTQLRIRTNTGTLWPGAWLGSAPWGYGDEVERALGTDGEVEMDWSLGAHDDPQRLVMEAIESVNNGDPVPFLIGDGTIPRHYVLLVEQSGDQLTFYESGSGKLRTVSVEDFIEGGDNAAKALGWPSIHGAGKL